jgi:PST family polysaccharide transporter
MLFHDSVRLAIDAVKQKFSPSLRKIISNTSWLLADRILRMSLGLFVGVWVARYLGPEQFGLFNYAIAFAGLFSTFATLGLNSIVVRDIIREPSCKNETLGTTFALKLVSGIATLLLAIGTISILRPKDNLTHWLVTITAVGLIFQAFDTIDLWFQAQVQSKYTVFAKTTAYLLISLVKIALIQMKAPLIQFAWIGLLEIVLSTMGLVIVYRLNGGDFRALRATLPRAKSLIKESWPLIFSGLAITIYLRADMIMLGEMLDDKAVGIYSVATRISELWYFIPMAIVSSVSPSIIAAKKMSEALYYQQLQRTFNFLAGIAYVVAIPITFFSKTIVIALFGQNYAASGVVLSIHIWAGLFVCLGITKSTWIITEGYIKLALIGTFLGAITNVLLNFLLIPNQKEIGAAIATIISYGISDYLVFILYPPFRKVGVLMTNALTFRFLISGS